MEGNESSQMVVAALNQLSGEIRDLRKDLTTFSLDSMSRVSALEQSNRALIGNGQPGRVTVLETKVDVLEKDRDEAAGAHKRARLWSAGAGSITATLVEVMFRVAGMMTAK